MSNNLINKKDLITYLIESLQKEDFTQDLLYNENTFNWIKGYKGGILSTIELINGYDKE